MSKNEKISAVIIAKNEANVILRLLNSLKGIDEIIVMDTGSSDDTIKIAKDFGCKVIEVGDKFKIKATQKQVKKWKQIYGYEPSFKVGQGYFHFAKARNYAATFARNDWIFTPDADEIVTWDLDKVHKVIQTADHLVYRFCYKYAPDGTCGIEFSHSKFFRKSKLKWIGGTHEIYTLIKGQIVKSPEYVPFIYLHHYQEPKLERNNYLPGLELAVLENANIDRNLFYLAREWYYQGKKDNYATAVKMFGFSIPKIKWMPEKSEAYNFLAQCYQAQGKINKAIECFHESIKIYNERREPFWELSNLYKNQHNYHKAISYALAATGVPFRKQGYLNSKELYSWKIEDLLTFLYGELGNRPKSKYHWLEALKYNPPKVVLKNGFHCFYKGFNPLVSIVIPTVRVKGYKRLIDSIKQNTFYEHYEIIKMGGKGTAIKKFNKGVEKARGTFVVYLADDCEVKSGWLIQALTCFKENFKDKGLVIFNDDYWRGILANHFVCSKNITEELDGKIWSEAYHHCSVDVELSCRLRAKNLIAYCKEAQIIHHHHFSPSKGIKSRPRDKYDDWVDKYTREDRILLPKRLEKLGLHKDAVKYQQWYDKLLQGDPKGPERIAVGKLSPIPLYETMRYAWAAKHAMGKTVLDIGCSSGFGSRFFEGFDYTGLDYNEEIIEFARDQYANKKVMFIHKDINKHNIGFYDNIIIFECLEHLKNGKELAQELKEHCNNLFCTVPYKEPPGAWGQYHLIHNLVEADFPDFEYMWMHPDGKLHDCPNPVHFNLMFLKWSKFAK